MSIPIDRQSLCGQLYKFLWLYVARLSIYKQMMIGSIFKNASTSPQEIRGSNLVAESASTCWLLQIFQNIAKITYFQISRACSGATQLKQVKFLWVRARRNKWHFRFCVKTIFLFISLTLMMHNGWYIATFTWF